MDTAATFSTTAVDEATEHSDRWACFQGPERDEQTLRRPTAKEVAAYERSQIRARWDAEDALAAASRQLESAARAMLGHGFSVEEVAKRSGLTAVQVTPGADPYLQPEPFTTELNPDNPFD